MMLNQKNEDSIATEIRGNSWFSSVVQGVQIVCVNTDHDEAVAAACTALFWEKQYIIIVGRGSNES